MYLKKHNKTTTRKKSKNLQYTGKKDQCQCSSSCIKKCFGKTPFCLVHQSKDSKCSRISPLSGSEPDYDPDAWNKRYNIKETHNCFAYSFNINDFSLF
jgi:hypothetical protein